MTLPFTNSVMICLAGASQSGKNEQIRRIANYKDPSGAYPFRPVFAMICETSARGTTGALLGSEGVRLFPVKTLDDFISGCDEAAEGHNGTPYGMMVFDGWTTFQEGLNTEDRIHAMKAAAIAAGVDENDSEVLAKGRSLDPKDLQNDNFRLAKGPADMTRVALKYWNDLAARVEGTLLMSTCIVRDDLKQVGKGRDMQLVQIGEKLALAPSPSEYLNIYHNLVLYLGVDLPEIESPEDANDTEEEGVYFILSRRFTVGGMKLNFIKWQDGIIDLPKYTPNPNLGDVLGRSPLRRAAPAASKPSKK